MAELLTRLDLFEIGRQFVLTRNPRIEPKIVDTEGSDANVFIGSQSYVAHAIVRQLAERLNALLLDGAFGEDLDRYVFDRYQEIRKGAAAAVGSVRFFRTSAAAGAGTILIGTKLIGLTGVEYITTTAATFAAADLEVSADVRSSQAGKDFQVGRNQLRRFDNAGLIFDDTMQLNNDEPTAGGEPAETDDTFRERMRAFFNAARRGTLGAIEFGALRVPGVVSAQAVEALQDAARPARVVSMSISDSSGVASAALGDSVRVELLDFRAAGIFVVINLSLPQIVDVILTLTFRAGVDTATLTDQIRTAIVEFINSLPVNAPLLRNDLGAVLARFRNSGLVPDDSTVVEPAGDLQPEPGQTLRTTLTQVALAA